MALRSSTRTRIADEKHLEFLLDEAEGALDRGETGLGITHLLQAVFIAHSKRSAMLDLDVARRVRRLGDAHGSIGA